MPTIVTMPKWGLTMTSGTITNWSREEGDPVTEGVPLLTVETEKAVDDVEAPASGVLRKIVAAVGSEVPVMGAVAVITALGEDLSDEEVQALVTTRSGATAAAGGAAPRVAREGRQAARDTSGRVNASPAARKRAGELGIDLETVEATGPGGRITSEDVERAAETWLASAAAPRSEVVELADGTNIATLVAGPPEATGTIVFLHGLGGSQSTWGSVLRRFRGDSPHRRSRPTRPRRQRQTVARVDRLLGPGIGRQDRRASREAGAFTGCPDRPLSWWCNGTATRARPA